MTKKKDENKPRYFNYSVAAAALALLAQSDGSGGTTVEKLLANARELAPSLATFDQTGMVTSTPADDDSDKTKDKDEDEEDKDKDGDNWHSSHSSHASHHSSGER